MKIFTNQLPVKLFVFLIVLTGNRHVMAQLPACGNGDSSGIAYIHNGNNIWNYDPFQPISATNPVLNTISMPPGASGLSVGNNLNSGTAPSPTFYTNVGGQYYYYDGTAWVNTGHASSTVNLGSGGDYIFGLEGGSGTVYKYDGTGNDVMLLVVPGFNGGGPFDLVGDCAGNFYILRCQNPNPFLRKYDANGNLLQQWTITNTPSAYAGGGFAIVGNTLIVHNTVGLYAGPIGATTVTLAPVVPNTPFPGPSDMGSCPLGGTPVSINDTLFSCSDTGVTVVPQGDTPYSYTLLNGSATVTDNGTDFTIVPNTLSTVLIHSFSNSPCSVGGVKTDTYLVVPPPKIDAGISDTLLGCASWIDTLNGSVTNTTPWINYTLSWSPASSISSGGNTTSPVITPTANTTFMFQVVTDASQGGCVITDSVPVYLKDESVVANFNFEVRPGCTSDTVIFTDSSLYNTSVLWHFGDGQTDTVLNPVHIYPNQGIYNVWLTVRNASCVDSTIKIVDTRHPLIAGFTQSEDSVCQADGTPVQLTDTSTGASGYFWDFGDGATSNLQSPGHIYTLAGTHQIMQVIHDNIPCYDTAVHTIFVDSLPYLDLITDKTDICQGDEVNFRLNYLQPSLDVHWNFGDNVHWEEAVGTSHSYDREGNYLVTVQVDYPVCPATHDTVLIEVHPFPIVDLGPDSVLCLDGNPILLRNQYTANDPLTTWKWNTGDSSETLQVVHPGTYSLTGTLTECSTTESVKISKDCYTDIPNAFTPNGDGENDYFFPRQYLSEGVIAFSMNIFNRWGQKVFETNNTNGRGWDGKFNDKEQPMGVYIYNVTLKYKNGRNEKYTGNVTLVR